MGGLVSSIILAKEGLKVCVLEKNNQYGGNLQTFVRDKVIFDTGVHYIGGLEKGQNLYQYFKYLGIIDGLRLKRMDKDAYDYIPLMEIQTNIHMLKDMTTLLISFVFSFLKKEQPFKNIVIKSEGFVIPFPCITLRKVRHTINRFFL